MVGGGDPFYLKFRANRPPLTFYWCKFNFLFARCYTVEALQVKIDRKSAISLQRGQFDPKFQVEGVAPGGTIFARIVV